MRSLGLGLGALVLVSMPLASACYRPRVESCRGPIGDFSGFSNVAATAIVPLAFEQATASVSATLTAQTTAPSGDVCVAVHAELRDAAGGLVDTLDTPIHATISGSSLQTSDILFYRESFLEPLTVHVTALGTTVDAVVTDPRRQDASFFPADAFVPRDAGVRDAALDARTIDAGDAAADASDASLADGALDAASLPDAGLDATP